MIGYTQYFTGLPAGLVWVHVTGSVAIWITALLIPYTLRDRGVATQCEPAAARAAFAPGRSDSADVFVPANGLARAAEPDSVRHGDAAVNGVTVTYTDSGGDGPPSSSATAT